MFAAHEVLQLLIARTYDSALVRASLPSGCYFGHKFGAFTRNFVLDLQTGGDGNLKERSGLVSVVNLPLQMVKLH